ncbi:unnamed protein product [Oikopleura dioica]|uniref:Aminotransferase class V domain-containing protein n=1 Tax=Oikopleura dioica TaxID=34765 RepID=E4Y500_OIKDI|nr:unnamed protein product [Oikopleura dioica]
MAFSKSYREDFLLDFKNFTFLNHGSYGAIPKVVMDRKKELLDEAERFPDDHFRNKAQEYYKEACVIAAEFVHAKVENVVLVKNTTQGVNAVLNCFPKTKKILINSHTYNAMRNMSDLHRTRWGCEIAEVKINMPIVSEDEIVKAFTDVMDENKDIDLAIIDHISSASALVFPIKRLIYECKKRNIICIIDGAHAPGQIDLHLDELGADFYVGNLHKWAYTPRGAAILWSDPKYHAILEPLTTSHLYKGTLHEKFFQQGTDDYSNFFTIPVSLKYHSDLSFEKLHAHADALFEYGRKRLCKEAGCSMYPVPASMEAPFMKIVKLPRTDRYPELNGIAITDNIIKQLLAQYNLVVAVTTTNGDMWMRISANCYTTKADLDRLVEVVKDATPKLF